MLADLTNWLNALAVLSATAIVPPLARDLLSSQKRYDDTHPLRPPRRSALRPLASAFDVVELMNRLLAPRTAVPGIEEQTLASTCRSCWKKRYEVLEALESGDAVHHREELAIFYFRWCSKPLCANARGISRR